MNNNSYDACGMSLLKEIFDSVMEVKIKKNIYLNAFLYALVKRGEKIIQKYIFSM